MQGNKLNFIGWLQYLHIFVNEKIADNYEEQSNNGLWTFEFCKKVFLFSKPAGLILPFYLAWNRKGTPFCENWNVEYNQITYHILQITVY